MNLNHSLPAFGVVAAGMALAACSGGGGSPTAEAPGTSAAGSAQLSISLMDAPVDDVESVFVEITALWLKSSEEGPAIELPMVESPIQVDLLELTEDNAALLVDGVDIDAGSYEWLAMDVNATIDGIFDSYAVTDTGLWREIFVPSGRVRLVDGFETEPNEALALIFDWDLRKGLVYPPGLGGRDTVAYILKPAFRIIDTAVFGRLSGTIDLATVTLGDNDCNADSIDLLDYDVGNAVYIFDGHDAVPDDLDEELDVTPLATVNAVLNDEATAYDYGTLLPFGDYTVAFTCQAANDGAETNETGNADPEDDTLAFLPAAVNVTLSATPGETSAIVDF